MSRKKPALDDDDGFFLGLFQGEHVTILSQKSTPQLSNEAEAFIEVPITFSGYLVHLDKSYFYLGESMAEITVAVPRNFIVAVLDTKSAHDEMSEIPSNEHMN